ncbi:hypothetical protein [Actinomadura soli]|uniref:hypothetical protein n=1 Tax=Actinomadura soli TaxID=2508997 RepID=UPI00148710F6|nr:hypothetical protein [Actinomadura soli]
MRTRFSDPVGYHQVLALLESGPVDGRDRRVQAIMLGNPSACELLDELADLPRIRH